MDDVTKLRINNARRKNCWEGGIRYEKGWLIGR